MPKKQNSVAVRQIHVAEIPDGRMRRLREFDPQGPRRSIKPNRLAIGTVAGRPGFALVLIDSARDAIEVELHPTVMLAIGQAEIEFGVSPADWCRAPRLGQ